MRGAGEVLCQVKPYTFSQRVNTQYLCRVIREKGWRHEGGRERWVYSRRYSCSYLMYLVYLDCGQTMFVVEDSLARNPHKEQAWSNQVAEFMVTWQGEVSGTLWN